MYKKRIAVILVALVAVVGILLWPSRFNFFPQLISVTLSAKGEEFPEINESNLDPAQKKIIDTARMEFKSQPRYTKYSEGNKEAWCADFVSWTINPQVYHL